jgi:hypothetical protein
MHRENDFFMSSLPDLIRQSMLIGKWPRYAAQIRSPDFSMDHRVKPGGDEVWGALRRENDLLYPLPRRPVAGPQ